MYNFNLNFNNINKKNYKTYNNSLLFSLFTKFNINIYEY